MLSGLRAWALDYSWKSLFLVGHEGALYKDEWIWTFSLLGDALPDVGFKASNFIEQQRRECILRASLC